MLLHAIQIDDIGGFAQPPERIGEATDDRPPFELPRFGCQPGGEGNGDVEITIWASASRRA